MMKFATHVNDETGKKFRQYCDERGISAYAFLSRVIHKAVGTTPPPENRPEATTLAIQRKQRTLTGAQPVVRTCERCGRPHGDCAHTSTDE